MDNPNTSKYCRYKGFNTRHNSHKDVNLWVCYAVKDPSNPCQGSPDSTRTLTPGPLTPGLCPRGRGEAPLSPWERGWG